MIAVSIVVRGINGETKPDPLCFGNIRMKFNRNIGLVPIFRLGVSFRVTQKRGFSLIPEVQNTQAWATKSYSISGPPCRV